jgi:hypothetical protein
MPKIKTNCQNCGAERWYQPSRIKYGRGKWCSRRCKYEGEKEALLKNRRIEPTEENSPNWKGDDIEYSAVHKWVYKTLGKTRTCQHCGDTDLDGPNINWANKSGLYLRIPSDWLRLCVRCHRRYDRENKIEYSPTPLAAGR